MKYSILILTILSILFISCVIYPDEKIADNETLYTINTEGYVYYIKSYSVYSSNCINFIYEGRDKIVCGSYTITKYLPKTK